MCKIFIFGSSGHLGKFIIKKINSNLAKVHCYSSKYKKKYFNLLDIKTYGVCSKIGKDDIVIFLSSVSDKNEVNINYQFQKKLNSYSKDFLKKLSAKSCMIIFLSSVEVFNGTKNGYKSNFKPKPISKYGVLKYDIEKFIIKNFGKYLIIRSGWVITQVNSRNRCIIYNTYTNMLKDECKYAIDNYISLLSIDDLSEFIYKIINDKISYSGILHLSTIEKISRNDLAKLIIKNSKNNTLSYKKVMNKDLNFNLPKNNFLINDKIDYSLSRNKLIKLIEDKIKNLDKMFV